MRVHRVIYSIFQCCDIIYTDAHDPGVEAVIEVEVPLMTLHLARSDRRKSSREKGDDQVKLSIIFIRIVDQPVLRGG